MKKVNNFFSYIWDKFKHNWGLKLLSLFFAIMLWNTVIAATNPEVTRTIDKLPITVVGDKQLSEKNLALLKSISSYIRAAKVTVDIKRNELADFDENLITVNLNLATISSAGRYDIKLMAYTSQGTVKRVSPQSIIVEVDEKANRVIPVECEVTGELTDNYFGGSLKVTPNSIQISGAKSILQDIERAYLKLDLNDRQESISLLRSYTFIDNSGSAIDSSSLDISSDSVLLEMSITPKKWLYITPVLLGEDKLKDGYEITEIEVEPEMVEVTGTAELLEGRTSLPTEPIDLTGHWDNIQISELKILIPEDIKLLGIDSSAVLIVIEETMTQGSFEQVDIELRNIPDGMSAQDFDNKIDITFLAPVNTISSIRSSDFKLYVDMTGMLKGDISLPILYETSEEYRIENIVMSQETLTGILK